MTENTSWVDPQDARRLSDELHHWFKDRAEQEARLVAPKAIEYGSRSLIAIGRDLAHLGNRTVEDPEAIELAIWAFIKGKMERWTEAVMNGKPVSDDTLLDMGLYVKMAQRTREVGSWPGVQLKAHPLDVTLVTGATFNHTNVHRTRTLNSEWRMEKRGELKVGQYRLPQFDIISKHTGETGEQLVQYADPVIGFHTEEHPDPHCSGWHSPDYGFCLRTNVTDIKLYPPIPQKEF